MLMAAAAAPIPPPTCTVSQTVRLGSTIGARCVETRLLQMGLITWAPDDMFDWNSAYVLGVYQPTVGLAATSVADPATLASMGIWRAPPGPSCTVSVPVRLGSSLGARCVESRLQQLGYISSVDEFFDWNSAYTLGLYQRSAGLSATSVADPSTLSSLGIWGNPGAPTCSVSVQVRMNSTAGAACVETRMRQMGLIGSTPDDVFDWNSAYVLGLYQYNIGLPATSVGNDWTLWYLGVWQHPAAPTCRVSAAVPPGATVGARCVETRLAQLGLFGGTPDDYFDWDSYFSVQHAQRSFGLAVTGTADPATLAALQIWNPEFGLPANSGSGRRIVYSRAQQRIWLVEANGTVYNTHRVSGRTYEPSAGTYHVYSRSEYTYSASDPSVRWRYMVRFTYGFQGGRIGFHEIPNRNGRPLQTKEQLGLPLSGGCVRQSTDDAIIVWNWAPIGTTVVVL